MNRGPFRGLVRSLEYVPVHERYGSVFLGKPFLWFQRTPRGKLPSLGSPAANGSPKYALSRKAFVLQNGHLGKYATLGCPKKVPQSAQPGVVPCICFVGGYNIPKKPSLLLPQGWKVVTPPQKHGDYPKIRGRTKRVVFPLRCPLKHPQNYLCFKQIHSPIVWPPCCGHFPGTC